MRRQPSIDKATLFEKLGYTPRAEQWDFHNSDARFRIPCCGRRFGKSLQSGNDLTVDCFIPDSYYWICGPTYKLAEKEFRVVHNNFIHKLKLGPQLRVSYNAKQGDMRIEFPWNTIVECVSATNPDSLLGEGLDGVIMSEAARHSRETWEQYVEPALSDKRGWATFPSTPKGFNWYKGLFDIGQDKASNPEYESWRFPTWMNTIRFPGGFDDPELVRIRSKASPAYWKQEYAAMFTAFEGQIYEEFDPQYHVKDLAFNPRWRNYWAIDFGFSDPFVVLDIQVDPEDNVYVWREYQVSYLSTWEHGQYLVSRENPDQYHVDGVFADPRAPDGIATLQLILPYGISARVVGWELGIEAVKRWLKLQPDGKPKLFFDRSCIHTIRQMNALRMATAKPDKNAPQKQHDHDDHGPDALRYFFGEFFVLGANQSLYDVYDPDPHRSEAESFFTYHSGIKIESPMNFG